MKRILSNAVWFSIGFALVVAALFGVMTSLQTSNPQNPSAVRVVPTPLFNLNDLNASEATQYNIHGLLTVGSSNGSISINALPGEIIHVQFNVSYVAYDGHDPFVIVAFHPIVGQEIVGSLDISSIESYSPSSLNVTSGHSVKVDLSAQIPADIGQTTFKLLPNGMATTPNAGISVLYENDVTVNVQ